MPLFPLLSQSDHAFYPKGKRCPVCRGSFKQGFAYLDAGALLLSKDGADSIHDDRTRAFLDIGFHGIDTSMRDSANVSIVDDLAGGQFDLAWCSVACMRKWFNGLLDKIEKQVLRGRNRAAIASRRKS